MYNGPFDLPWWGYVLVALALTHVTIVSVTVFLHRHQAHRALELHALPSHFFRFWLWLTTGMVTKEWAAIHRKHHAKCETAEDPHSPQTRGLHKVLWEGAELYRAEAKNVETLQRYGHGTPDDWLERKVYRHSILGVAIMLVIDLVAFGPLGLTIWAVQMAWIPFWAAGVVNGVGHFWGYRNYDCDDASRNLLPWGILIGGEELHNNHHTYPTSAKLSVKPYEFDIGWGYIRAMEMLGWAKVRKTPPMLKLGEVKPVADDKTLDAIIANRYEVMATYATELRAACGAELDRLKAQGGENTARIKQMLIAKRWLHRDQDKIPAELRDSVAQAAASSAMTAGAGVTTWPTLFAAVPCPFCPLPLLFTREASLTERRNARPEGQRERSSTRNASVRA